VRFVIASRAKSLFSMTVLLLAATAMAAPAVNGPLRISRTNARYFTAASGRAILLVGSHTWDNLQDMGQSDSPAAFDFDAYLECHWIKLPGSRIVLFCTPIAV